MGARGPQPAPTPLKLVKGTRKDRVNRVEPVPSARQIQPPDWLSEEACEVWAEYAPDLVRAEVLTAWDIEQFAAWCDAVVRRRRAAAALDAEGEVVESEVFDRNGKVTGSRWVKNPWQQVWKDAHDVVARIGARFGLTPTERAQLKAGGDGNRQPGEDLLS